MTGWAEASASPCGRDVFELAGHKGGDRAESPTADDRVRSDLNEGGVGAKHPGGNHESPAGGIANGYRLVTLARSHDRKFLAMQRVEGVLDDNGGTYGVMTPSW